LSSLYELVISLYFPGVIASISVVIFDSSNVTVSESVNLSEFKYTTPRTLVNGFETTLAMDLLSLPRIFSPIIALVDTLALEPNCILSKVGAEESNDS
jgi:hypothetical protein